jgi:hypothetical protein
MKALKDIANWLERLDIFPDEEVKRKAAVTALRGIAEALSILRKVLDV